MTYTFKELSFAAPRIVAGYEIGFSDDFYAAVRLHNHLFPNTDASHEWFSWYLNLAKVSRVDVSTRIYGAEKDGELVGMWCVEPKLFRVSKDAQPVQVGRCFATGIHSDHRKAGLFTELSRFAIDEEKKHGDYDWIFGFPQVGRAVIKGHLKAGWEPVQVIKARGMPVEGCRGWNISLSSFLQDAWRGNTKRVSYAGSFDEPLVYKRRRWQEHPDHHYINLSYDSAVTSNMTIKQYGSVMHILDVEGDNEGILNLLRAASTLAYRHRATELTMWCADNDAHVKQVDHCEFGDATATPSIEWLTVPLKRSIEVLHNVDSIHISMGAEEGY